MGCVATGGSSQGWGEAAVASGIIAALQVLICQGPWEVVLVCSPGDMQLTGAWIMGDQLGRWPRGGPGCSISFETNTGLGRAFLAHRHRAKAE